MNERARELAKRLEKFNAEVIAFVENCGEQDWRKVCSWEQWPVGVAARHIGAGHYAAVELAAMIIRGEKLPELTAEQITEMANRHAREHDGCTKPEVLEVLKKNGREMVNFVAGLEDSQLDRTTYLTIMGGDVTARQFIEAVVLDSGKHHLENMKAAAGP